MNMNKIINLLYLYISIYNKISKNILSVHLVILTEMNRETLKKNSRKQKDFF